MTLNEKQQSDLLNFTNHFAERLQDALDAGQHPWGSGNAMSDVLGEYDDWHKVNIDGQTLETEEKTQDLTKMKTTKAFRSDGNVRDFRFTDTAYCPYCEAENDNLFIVKKEGNCTIVKNSCQYDTDEANAMMFECKCWSCGDTFRVDYFKEV